MDIYDNIGKTMVKGLMIHDQLSQYFAFLGFYGYSKFHEHQYMEESKRYQEFCMDYTKKYGKLIHMDKINNPDVIPVSWYNYATDDVDTQTKVKSIKAGFQAWINWEAEVIDILKVEYGKAFENDELYTANVIMDILVDVTNELERAKEKLRDLEFTGFDMVYITDCQKTLIDKYTL